VVRCKTASGHTGASELVADLLDRHPAAVLDPDLDRLKLFLRPPDVEEFFLVEFDADLLLGRDAG
jgi:hypothetical protein